jgi:AcrR family transcriptional regulator
MTYSHNPEIAQLVNALASEDMPHLKGMGRRERRAAETRLRLFRCALQLFAERGFPNVTIENITEAADVGKGTFFNYFESKEGVLAVMAEIQLGKVREALEQATAGKRSIQSVFRRLFERVAEEPGRSPDLARAFVSSFLASPVIRQQTGGSMSEGRRMAAEIVSLGQERGEIDAKLNKDQVALFLLQSFLGTLLLWSLHSEPSLQTAAASTFQYFWKAIAAPEES